MINQDQVDEVLDKFDSALAGASADEPQMPFHTACILSREQEDRMVEHAIQRIRDLGSEMGRDVCGNDDWWQNGREQSKDGENINSPQRTFMGKRKLFEMTYENEVDWRKYIHPGLYSKSNLVVPIARRITRQMIARANSYFFGTDPWFAAYPVGDSDSELARKAMKYGQFKARQAGSRAVHETANEKAFVLGEAVVKSTYKISETIYKKYMDVMVDAEGRDILDSKGEYITPDDQWIPSDEDEAEQSAFVLKRDGVTQKPDDPIFVQKLVSRRRTTYNAPEQKVLHYKDFLCPLNAETTDEADICVHLYDIPVMDLVDHWAKRGMVDLTADQSNDITAKAVEVLRSMHTSSGSTDNGTNSAREELGESEYNAYFDMKESSAEVAECYLRYDADGDGLMEEIMLIIELKNQIPVFYDYLANITPDGKRPFSVDRINPVNGRWHGIGSMEMFESTQNIVDLLINRWNFSQTKSARVDFWDPQATLEGQRNPHLQVNWGSTYTLAPGKTAQDALQSVYLQEIKGDQLKDLAEFFLQLAMNESGIQHANDNFVAGMDSTKLATGIRNIEKTGQEMFSVYISHLEPGHTDTLQKFFDLLMANIDPSEVITYFEDDKPDELIQIAGEEVMDVRLNVNILLTRQRGEEIMESSARAVELITRYYQLPPEVRAVTAPLFREMLRALNVSNADSIINGETVIPIIDGAPLAQMNTEALTAAATSPPRQSPANI